MFQTMLSPCCHDNGRLYALQNMKLGSQLFVQHRLHKAVFSNKLTHTIIYSDSLNFQFNLNTGNKFSLSIYSIYLNDDKNVDA